MKRVYSSESAAMAWHIRNVLEQHQIDSVVKNDRLFSASGDIPFTECLAEVWVKNKLDYQRAERIIREIATEPVDSGPDWVCAKCGETNTASYAICWNCEASHDEVGHD